MLYPDLFTGTSREAVAASLTALRRKGEKKRLLVVSEAELRQRAAEEEALIAEREAEQKEKEKEKEKEREEKTKAAKSKSTQQEPARRDKYKEKERGKEKEKEKGTKGGEEEEGRQEMNHHHHHHHDNNNNNHNKVINTHVRFDKEKTSHVRFWSGDRDGEHQHKGKEGKSGEEDAKNNPRDGGGEKNRGREKVGGTVSAGKRKRR